MRPSNSAVAISLGPTNPKLIVIALETLIFRREGVSPSLRLLVPTFLLPHAPPWVAPLASTLSGILSYHAMLSEDRIASLVSVHSLAPIIFGAKSLDE